MQVIDEAGDSQTAIDRVRELSPDVVVMDITMPNFNGINAPRQIVSDFPDTRVVAPSVHSGKRIVEGMLAARAAGYILKLSAPEELVKGTRAVMRGDIYLGRQKFYSIKMAEPRYRPCLYFLRFKVIFLAAYANKALPFRTVFDA
jgi:DNA-binding NarL/FixJ family response regulator